jgi:hypothetical protein
MRQDQHFYQHQFGELACLAKFSRDPKVRAILAESSPGEAESFAKSWFYQQVIRYRELWELQQRAEPA